MFEILQGDALDVLRTLPDDLARCCVTSPAYWGLRDYGTATWEGGDAACDHRSPTMRAGRNEERPKLAGSVATNSAQLLLAHRTGCGKCGAQRVDLQLGLEATPEEYVEKLVEVFREVRRVLADDGTLWLNLGDSYAAGKQGQDSFGDPSSGLNNGKPGANNKTGERMKTTQRKPPPGFKPKDLVGIPWRVAFALQADGWWLRSDIIWSKPNPMPESITDRPTKAHEYLFLLAKSQRYYYDADAIAEDGTGRAPGNKGPHKYAAAYEAGDERHRTAGGLERIREGYNTRNRRSVWTVTTQPFPGAHFAVMPQSLVEPCILAGSAPGDTVLDPFAGSGTVGVVALRHGRNPRLIELKPEYCEMARHRIAGPLFADAQPLTKERGEEQAGGSDRL